MRGEAFIEGQSAIDLASITTAINTEALEKIKSDYGQKYYLKIEPLFDYISKNKLNIEYNNKLIQSIEDSVNIYYHINNVVLINILNYVEGNVINNLKKLQTSVMNDKIPKKLQPPKKELAKPTITIYHIRYKAMLLRYIAFLLTLFI
jgi:hypothetical protein